MDVELQVCHRAQRCGWCLLEGRSAHSGHNGRGGDVDDERAQTDCASAVMMSIGRAPSRLGAEKRKLTPGMSASFSVGTRLV